MKVTIVHNGYHGFTTVKLSLKGDPGDNIQLSPYQIKRLSRAACGMSDCRCGETLIPALSDSGTAQFPCMIEIPGSGGISINGNYPN